MKRFICNTRKNTAEVFEFNSRDISSAIKFALQDMFKKHAPNLTAHAVSGTNIFQAYEKLPNGALSSHGENFYLVEV